MNPLRLTALDASLLLLRKKGRWVVGLRLTLAFCCARWEVVWGFDADFSGEDVVASVLNREVAGFGDWGLLRV